MGHVPHSNLDTHFVLVHLKIVGKDVAKSNKKVVDKHDSRNLKNFANITKS